MGTIRHRAAALLLSAFAATAALGLAAAPAQAATADTESSSSSPGVLGGLLGDVNLVNVFIGNYQINN